MKEESREERGSGYYDKKKKRIIGSRLLSLSKTLHVHQLEVPALDADEFLMRSTLNNLTPVKHVDDIGLLDRT